MQSAIHEGYEYQDYFTVSIILQLMLRQTDAEIIIDRKDFSGDKFDDLKVKTPNNTTEFQVKYSDSESSHKLTKDDFAKDDTSRNIPLLKTKTPPRQDLVMTDCEKVYYNAFIDIMVCMIEKYGPQVFKELEEKCTSKTP